MTLSLETKRNLAYLGIVFLGCLISVYDNVLSVVYIEDLPRIEENPFADSIIAYGGVKLLVLVKAITTICACLISIMVVYSKYRRTLWVVLLVQLCLFYYLSFHDDALVRENVLNPPLVEAIEFYRSRL